MPDLLKVTFNGESEKAAKRNLAAFADPWEKPIPLGEAAPPPFPVERLPGWLADWVMAVAEATQTPHDLAAALALANVAAAIAGKYRVEIRPGWQEPLNLFFVVALLPGERKSAVFAEAMGPVVLFEKQAVERMAPQIAAAQSEHRILEKSLEAKEKEAAKESNDGDGQQLARHEAKRLAQKLAAYVVPEAPQLLCDDVTPEQLGQLLAAQGGKMLLASPEGTAFEIAEGRYSKKPNFEVYLKGHSGDSLRTDRVGREGERVDQPALTAALAIQPDVIRSLADQTAMRGRGWLARWLYCIPESVVGRRKTAADPVPDAVKSDYRENLLALWNLPGAVADSKPAAHVIEFSASADQALQAFERWLEPQLAAGEELSYLAGWANKLAGAVARIAGGLHAAASPTGPKDSISRETVLAAIAIGRGYLLPHAQAAFGIMAADETLEDAKALWASITRKVVEADRPPKRFSRRDCHTWLRAPLQTRGGPCTRLAGALRPRAHS